jgi:phage shock protein PspC (stress-responsive transcriptional regulator)
MIGYIIKEGIYIYLERRFKGVRYEEIEDMRMLLSKELSKEVEGVRERKEPYKGLVIKIIRLLIVIQTIMNPTYAIMIYVIYERLFLLIG